MLHQQHFVQLISKNISCVLNRNLEVWLNWFLESFSKSCFLSALSSPCAVCSFLGALLSRLELLRFFSMSKDFHSCSSFYSSGTSTLFCLALGSASCSGGWGWSLPLVLERVKIPVWLRMPFSSCRARWSVIPWASMEKGWKDLQLAPNPQWGWAQWPGWSTWSGRTWRAGTAPPWRTGPPWRTKCQSISWVQPTRSRNQLQSSSRSPPSWPPSQKEARRKVARTKHLIGQTVQVCVISSPFKCISDHHQDHRETEPCT